MLLFAAELGVKNVTPWMWQTQRCALQVSLQGQMCCPATGSMVSRQLLELAAASGVKPFPEEPEFNDRGRRGYKGIAILA